ncbi:uncharacterized protein LOC143883674 isoform X1 [Tasmannia lanceolata]|uniref:uncharacterized protein LOC143883674 isoform X1 n=1 Tax=Tasmannia lanceolata TaxID=3420 RepID=UPI0040645605
MSKGKQKKERRELLRFCLPKSSSSSPFLSFAVSVVLPAKNPLRRTPHPIKEAEVFRRSHPCTLQSHLLQSKRYCLFLNITSLTYFICLGLLMFLGWDCFRCGPCLNG